MREHSIGKTIAALRKSKGWTQAELAEKLNVSDKAVSKWENEAGLPEISQLPAMANLFGVTIDYLMTGKVDENLPIDDMDSVKRMLYLIKKDDVDNYIKYGYLAETYFDDFKSENSAIASIVKNKSKKIFDACVKNGIVLRMSNYYGNSLVSAIYEHIDELIKMACESDCLEFLTAIDLLSFAVGYKNRQYIINAGFKHTYDSKTAYLVSPKTFEFIFINPTTSDRIIKYVSTYRKFQAQAISYGTSVCDRNEINGNFYFLEQNIIEQLYKTKRFELLSAYLKQIALDTANTIESYKQCGYENQVSYKIENGYLLRNDIGSYGKTTVIGKLITIDRQIIDLAISNLDEQWTKEFVEYNRAVISNATMGIFRYEGRLPFAPTDEELATLFDDTKRQKRIEKINENKTLTDKQRREQLYKEGMLSVFDAMQADDYDLFVKFPEETIDSVSLLDIVNADCKDVRFYIHAVNVDDNINDLNIALKTVLEKYPARYDILDALLCAGAVIDENLAFTNILKQNVAINLNGKETTIANIQVDNSVSKEGLLNAISDGKLEYAIVNLTIVLEKKLKNMLSNQSLDLIDMIDKVHSNGTINDFECKMLHNLRKARNGIMHQSGKFYYTEPIVKTWIRIVYSL